MAQVYDVDKLITQARRLAADYRRATGKTLPGVSVEIAENDAARLLGLELVEDRTQGYDAIGLADSNMEGLKVLIKGRTIFDESKSGQRIGQIKADKPWDAVVLVLMDEDYEPFEIYTGYREDLIEHLDDVSSRSKKRGAMSVARFKILSELSWTREDGLEEAVWDNQGGS